MKKLAFCSSCHTLNRIDLNMGAKTPQCGKCKTELSIPKKAVNINDENIDKVINNAELPILIDVYADWCGPCKIFGPIFNEVASEDWKKAEFFKLDSDKCPSTSAKYGIRGIPTTLVFYKGKLVNTQSGLINQAQLRNLIQSSYQN